ncbi:YbaK/EbsC family protein [Candidatus Uhrbacteria bacterium]|nr:YbaK/EbsC family protein [Candidatus Uhrbacteria bacterium]
MPIPKKVLNYLTALKIKAKPIAHKTVYTAYDAAATMKAKLNEIPKVLHVVADKKRHIIVVVPASYQVDFQALKKALKAKKVELASEKLMAKAFKVKAGAMTAFGGMYKGTEVLVDRAFARAKRVIAGAGTYTDSLEMKTKDFMKASGGKMGVYGKKR